MYVSDDIYSANINHIWLSSALYCSLATSLPFSISIWISFFFFCLFCDFDLWHASGPCRPHRQRGRQAADRQAHKQGGQWGRGKQSCRRWGGRKGAGEARARTAKRVQLTPQPGDNIYNSVARLNSFGSVWLCPECRQCCARTCAACLDPCRSRCAWVSATYVSV